MDSFFIEVSGVHIRQYPKSLLFAVCKALPIDPHVAWNKEFGDKAFQLFLPILFE